jgi:hypothetical protein
MNKRAGQTSKRLVESGRQVELVDISIYPEKQQSMFHAILSMISSGYFCAIINQL